MRCSVMALLANLVLAAGKIGVGLMTHTISMTGDGVNNLSDAAGSLGILLFGRAAARPGDEHHPYGHGRMEYLATLLVGALVLLMSVDVFRSALDSVRSSSNPGLDGNMAAVMAGSILVKLGMGVYADKKGKTCRAELLRAQARDSFMDVLSTSAIFIGLAVGHFTGWPLDGCLGLLVSLLIFWEGLDICRRTSDVLIGREPDRETGRRILGILEEIPGILSVHDLRLHDYGPGRTVASVDVVVDGEKTLNELHPLADMAERRVMETLGIPMTVHLDPAQTGSEEEERLRAELEKHLRTFPGCRMHDLALYRADGEMVLSFDLLVPAGFGDTEKAEQTLRDAAEKFCPGIRCRIQVDVDYYEHPQNVEREGL